MALLVISYSRQDQRIIRAVVKLLQGAMRDVIEKTVFWDEDFEPGEPWFEQIKLYIDSAPQIFVFWCAHSSSSQQVRREFVYALENRKRIVPVLLDNTPLAKELASISGIDLRGAVKHISPNKTSSHTPPLGADDARHRDANTETYREHRRPSQRRDATGNAARQGQAYQRYKDAHDHNHFPQDRTKRSAGGELHSTGCLRIALLAGVVIGVIAGAVLFVSWLVSGPNLVNPPLPVGAKRLYKPVLPFLWAGAWIGILLLLWLKYLRAQSIARGVVDEFSKFLQEPTQAQ